MNEGEKRLPFTETVENYINFNYKTDSEKVTELVVEMHEWGRGILSDKMIAACWTHAVTSLANNDGLRYDDSTPKHHVPTLLAAIKEFEKGVEERYKNLPLSRHVQILAIAETASAKREIGRVHFTKNTSGEIHLQKSRELLDLWQKLKILDNNLTSV